MAATSSLVVKLVASPFIGLTAAGWLLVVIGFGIGRTDTPLLLETPSPYPYWIVSIVGPFTFIAAIFQLFADKMKLPYAAAVSHIAGAIVSALNLHQMVAIVLAAFLSTFFLTGLGMILYVLGVVIRTFTEAGGVRQIPLWITLAFAGSVLATLFWTVVIILWHFKDVGKNDE